jgi:hypothetical protein
MKDKTYEVYIDMLCCQWEKRKLTLQAETEEKAKIKALNYEDVLDDETIKIYDDIECDLIEINETEKIVEIKE